MVRPDCQSHGGRYHTKGWRPHRIATLFGELRVRLPHLVRAGRGCGKTGVSWPLHCRSTPELDQLQARFSALMPYRVAADVLQHLLPIDAGTGPEISRSYTREVANPSYSVRSDGAYHRWGKDPPRELLIDLVADERLGRVTGQVEAS